MKPGDLVACTDAPEVLGAVFRVLPGRCLVLWSCGGNDLDTVPTHRLFRVRHALLEDRPCEPVR